MLSCNLLHNRTATRLNRENSPPRSFLLVRSRLHRIQRERSHCVLLRVNMSQQLSVLDNELLEKHF